MEKWIRLLVSLVSKSGVAALVYAALGEVAVCISILACFRPIVL